jgi:hypothetical protein
MARDTIADVSSSRAVDNTALPLSVRAPALPLTERVLRRLGRPRLLWIALWALVALVSPVVFTNAILLSGHEIAPSDRLDLVVNQGVLAFAAFVLLLGTGVLTSHAAMAKEAVARLLRGEPDSDLFQRIGSVPGPLALTAIVVVTTSVRGWAAYGPIPPLATLVPSSIYLIPIMTFVWVYLTILVDVDRLGREPLALESTYPQDRTLGLKRIGSVASTGLGLLFVAAVPIMLIAVDDPVTLGISLIVVLITVAVFVLSMIRLHRQMVAVKERSVFQAQRLYAEIYAPIRARGDAASLEEQSNVLRAAQALEERADNLTTWPIDEGTLRFIAVVITGVVTSLIVRGIFAALGF